MPFPIFPLFKIFRKRVATSPQERADNHPPSNTSTSLIVRRHFYNERGFQTYGSFFAHWDGWITAAHVLEEAKNLTPDFAKGAILSRPNDLDACLIGCDIPNTPPPKPQNGLSVYCIGYPAGSDAPARRDAKIYLERPGQNGQWIAHILSPDEPVVTGMSGGAVFDARTHTPIGIVITRNSPADLNNDRDPDESFDFIALSAVWQAINGDKIYV